MMLLIIPMGMMAQKTKVQQNNTQGVVGSKVYGEVTVQDFQGSASIKLDFGKVIGGITVDKMIMKDVEALRKMRFNSMADALNTLSSFGWEVELSYETTIRTGTITTIIISKGGQKLKKAEAPGKTIPQKGGKGKK